MAAESSRSSTSSADSYIGSLISLTSKSEIRYEGILYNINTEESSIGLRNVRSFGSEGRKKDGPQIMPSDKVYEYILFRGSDIKDLQVKSSPPAQPTQPINSDPAIIQSHYPRPAPPSSSLPAATSTTATGSSLPDPNTHGPQMGHPGSTFQGGMPLFQPGGNMPSWGPSPPPPNTNTSSLAMPMYWPGFYAPPNGLPQLHQQSLFRPNPGLSMPPSMQYPTLPEYSSTISANLTLPSSLPPVPPLLTTEPLPNLMQNKTTPTAPPLSLSPLITTTSPDVNVTIPLVSNALSGAKLPYQGMTHPTLVPTESPTPSLITPGQLLQSGPAAAVSSRLSQTVVHKDVEPAVLSEPSAPVLVTTEAQPPILPLPTQSRITPKPNGAPYQNRYNNNRGRERGRGSGGSRPVMKFTEEFDFTAMNEKFNKDEVWGTLGKTNKSGAKEKGGNASDEDELEDENNASLPKLDVKPVYSKDDFFDTLSSNSHDNQSNNGRTRFSEQMKLDTETFGEFSRYRGGRGGRGPYRGGRYRGAGGGGYHGRGYGYNYVGRGRGGGGGGRNPTPRDY